jgi:ABC-type nickel/cobalt efflux system permease component RcnA
MPPTDYKKYYIDNKSVILERSKNRYLEKKEHCSKMSLKYYHSNKEKILQKKKIKCQCACGGRHTKHQRKRHLKTKKHIKYLESLALSNGLILVRDIDTIFFNNEKDNNVE